jgi:hypothetical protein
MTREGQLLQEQVTLARNWLRLRLEYKTLGEALDGSTTPPTQIAGVDLLRDLVKEGVLLRDHSPRQAFTLLVLKGVGLFKEKRSA